MDKQEAHARFEEQRKIDPKISWGSFWRECKERNRTLLAVKAELSFKHNKPTSDTTMERCILWQRAAFRRG